MSLVNVSLEKVYIYFDTATFDEIERDEKVISEAWLNNSDLKVTMEAQLGLIGGTMGLLTGFSILSGVEIIYYLLRFLVWLGKVTQSSGSSCLSRFPELWWSLL